MKRLIVTDTHLGLYSDADAWLDIVLNFFKHIVKYCHQNDINEVVHLGDFFDNRKSLNTKTQHVAHRIAKVLGAKKDLKTKIIIGNHDCYYKNQIHPNTLELFKEYKHIEIIDDITLLDDILLVPWGMIPKDTQGAKSCWGHFAINGFHMNDSYRCKDGLDKVAFKDFENVLSGHFHTPSSNHNIRYLGAPYGQTFHDAGGIRGFHVLDNNELEFIEYKDAPKFIKIKTVSEPLNPDDVTGNIVKIIFTEDFGTVRNQDIIDNILKHKPFLYSVNFASIESKDDEILDESIEMDSKEQIVNQYIESQVFPSNINVETLKTMFMKLMREAGEGNTKIRSAEGTKIECLSVGFQNFLSFGSKWQEVPLHNGVNFVTGIDKDKGKSNGAGKSSFLETIPFALFGKTAREIKQDQIINWKNKKNCQVVFKFKINDEVYEINRRLKPNKLEIYKNGILLDQDAHKSDYQTMFEDIFGMDVKMFMSLVHSNINNSANVLNMKKAEKRVFLERMFGLKIYSDMNKLCNEKLRGVENKKFKVEHQITSAKENIENAEGLKRKFRTEISSKKNIIETVKETQEELDKLKEDNPTLNEDIGKLDKDIKKRIEKFTKITLEFEKWKSKKELEIEHTLKEIKQIEDQEEQRKKNTEIQARIKEIETEARGDVKELQEKIKRMDEYSSNYNEKTKKLNIDISNLEIDLAELRTDLRNIDKNLELLSEGTCPVCGQDVKDPKTHYKKEASSFKRKITNRDKKLETMRIERQTIRDEWDTIRENKSKYIFYKDKLYDLERQLKEVGSEERKDELIQKKVDNEKIYKRYVKKYNDKKIKHNDELFSLNNNLEDLMREQKIVKAKEKELELVESQAKEVKKHIESLNGMIKEQNDLIKETEDKVELAKINLTKLINISDYINSIKTILKDENIKQFTIKQIMPYMNKQTNYYLSEVNYGFYVSIDKWLDLDIKGPGIRNASYESLSGGERRGIDIAIQLSLLDISRTQAGCFPDLLVFDELLDSSIDSRGINELMKIVKVKQKEFGGKVFIITHRNELDSELIDNEYRVMKENGYSKVQI